MSTDPAAAASPRCSIQTLTESPVSHRGHAVNPPPPASRSPRLATDWLGTILEPPIACVAHIPARSASVLPFGVRRTVGLPDRSAPIAQDITRADPAAVVIAIRNRRGKLIGLRLIASLAEAATIAQRNGRLPAQEARSRRWHRAAAQQVLTVKPQLVLKKSITIQYGGDAERKNQQLRAGMCITHAIGGSKIVRIQSVARQAPDAGGDDAWPRWRRAIRSRSGSSTVGRPWLADRCSQSTLQPAPGAFSYALRDSPPLCGPTRPSTRSRLEVRVPAVLDRDRLLQHKLRLDRQHGRASPRATVGPVSRKATVPLGGTPAASANDAMSRSPMSFPRQFADGDDDLRGKGPPRSDVRRRWRRLAGKEHAAAGVGRRHGVMPGPQVRGVKPPCPVASSGTVTVRSYRW